MMTVGELMEALKKCDPEDRVFAQHRPIFSVDAVKVKTITGESEVRRYINLYVLEP